MNTNRGLKRLLLLAAVGTAATLVITGSPLSAREKVAVGESSCTSTAVVRPPLGRWETERGTMSADAIEDMRQLANQKGIRLSDAIDEYGWHNSFSLIVRAVQEAFPQHYSGARIEDHGSSRGWIAFASTTPPAAIDILRASPVPVEVREHCGHSEAELKRRLEQVHYAVLGHADVADASSGYDIETGKITVLVEASANSRGRIDLTEIVATLPPGADRLPVEIQVVDELKGGDDISIYGGRAISTCTTGFNVVGSNYRGTTTAAHCSNSQSYAGYALTFVSEHSGNYGDVQVHKLSGHTFPNVFTANGGNRAVNGVGAAIENQQMCLNGKSSGYHCDSVYQLNHCNGDRCGLVAMQNRVAAGGDSGGPWFSNNHAYGIHQGYKYWFGNRDLYTPVVYLPTSLGVSVATS